MIRPITLVCALLALWSGLYLYHAKHEVELMDKHIEAIAKETAGIRADSRHLMDQWIGLGEPETLRKYSDEFLGLKAVGPTQFVRLADLASRLPPPGLTQTAGPMDTTDQPAGLAAEAAAPADEADADPDALPIPPVPPDMLADATPDTAVPAAPVPVTPIPATPAPMAAAEEKPPVALPLALKPAAVKPGSAPPPAQIAGQSGARGALKPPIPVSLDPKPDAKPASPVQSAAASAPAPVRQARPQPAPAPAARPVAQAQAPVAPPRAVTAQTQPPAWAAPRPPAREGSLLGMTRVGLPAPTPVPVSATWQGR